MQLEAQLADRNVTIELSSAAKEWLAERGYDRLYGARPLARMIQEYIKKPLAEELLFGKLVKGGSVKVTMKDGKLDFEIIEAPGAGAAEAGRRRRWRHRPRGNRGVSKNSPQRRRGRRDRKISAPSASLRFIHCSYYAHSMTTVPTLSPRSTASCAAAAS